MLKPLIDREGAVRRDYVYILEDDKISEAEHLLEQLKGVQS